MVLTRTRNPSDQDAFPALQLFILGTLLASSSGLSGILADGRIAICRLAEPIALASCFPYAYPMVKDFRVGDEQNASLYAGIFISAFALAESLTGMFWGGVSDRVGRKPVLLCGCVGTMLSMLIVGVSTNFWSALAGRALGGLLSESTPSLLSITPSPITSSAFERSPWTQQGSPELSWILDRFRRDRRSMEMADDWGRWEYWGDPDHGRGNDHQPGPRT